jgi:hypothetical protein
MVEYRFTDYFENEVLRKRPYLKKEWCIRVCENPIRIAPQEHNRFPFGARLKNSAVKFSAGSLWRTG